MRINLSCLHVAVFNPPPVERGELLWCYRCQDWREYLSPVDPEIAYRIRCTACRYPRNFGANKREAYRSAVKHLIRHPDHKVRITLNGKLEKEITDATETIPGIPATQEWLESNPQHQGSLRALTLSIQAKRTTPPKAAV